MPVNLDNIGREFGFAHHQFFRDGSNNNILMWIKKIQNSLEILKLMLAKWGDVHSFTTYSAPYPKDSPKVISILLSGRTSSEGKPSKYSHYCKCFWKSDQKWHGVCCKHQQRLSLGGSWSSSSDTCQMMSSWSKYLSVKFLVKCNVA